MRLMAGVWLAGVGLMVVLLLTRLIDKPRTEQYDYGDKDEEGDEYEF